jgi:hypothetical protein
LEKSKIPPELAHAGFEFVGIDGLQIEGHRMEKSGVE